MTITEKTHPAVAVYSKPDCQPCKATKRSLDDRGVTYTSVDVSVDPAGLAYIQKLGYTSVPVVVVTAEGSLVSWSGYNPELIDAHFGRKPRRAGR